MKKVILLIFAMFAIALPSVAKDSKDNSSSLPIVIDSHPIDNSAGSDSFVPFT